MEFYTAEELADRVRAELGADVSPRTIYFYRHIGLLSPLEASGNQPRFTERHFLELAAALALQRAPDRPTLAEIATMLRGLSGDDLREIARAVGPTARELLANVPAARELNVLAEGAPPEEAGPGGGAGLVRERALMSAAGPPPRLSSPPPGVTINLAPDLTLHVGPDAPRELVSRLLEVSLGYGKGEGPKNAARAEAKTAPDRAEPAAGKTNGGTKG